MHLFQKLPKYAFAYACMQMHNYPKPNNNTSDNGGGGLNIFPILHDVIYGQSLMKNKSIGQTST